jgi:Aldo/keto reductase family
MDLGCYPIHSLAASRTTSPRRSLIAAWGAQGSTERSLHPGPNVTSASPICGYLHGPHCEGERLPEWTSPIWPNEGKLSALNVRRALDASLRRLQTDYVDLYQFHHVDRNTPWEEIWQAIEVAVQAGKILYAGSSNFAAGTSPTPRPPLPGETSWAWSASNRSITCSSVTSSSRWFRPRSITASGSSPGHHCRADYSVG